MDYWKNRVALVTGASAGIGAAIVKNLVKHGMTVVGCARSVDRIQALSKALQGESGKLFPIQCDLRDTSQILSMFEEIKANVGGVDVCINNAGLGKDAPLLSGTESQWTEMWEVNVLALCTCTREAVKLMKERKVDDGYVININSIAGHYVYDKVDHFYSATKHAVSALTEGVRRELREEKSRIRVSAISPGNVASEFGDRMYGYDRQLRAAKQEKEDVWLKCEQVADLVVSILSTPPSVQLHDMVVRSMDDHL